MDLLLNQQRNFVVTVGEDEQLPPQKATVCLKVFDLDKRQEEGSSTSAPECIQILRIFTNQFSEAKVHYISSFIDMCMHICEGLMQLVCFNWYMTAYGEFS